MLPRLMVRLDLAMRRLKFVGAGFTDLRTRNIVLNLAYRRLGRASAGKPPKGFRSFNVISVRLPYGSDLNRNGQCQNGSKDGPCLIASLPGSMDSLVIPYRC